MFFLFSLIILSNPAYSDFEKINISALNPASVYIGKRGASGGETYSFNGETYLVKPGTTGILDFDEAYAPCLLPDKFNSVKEVCVSDLYKLFIGEEAMTNVLIVDPTSKDFTKKFQVGSKIVDNFDNQSSIRDGTKNIELNLLVALLLGEVDRNPTNFGFSTKSNGETHFYKIDHGASLGKFDENFQHLPKNKNELLSAARDLFNLNEQRLPGKLISEQGVLNALLKIKSVPDHEIYKVLSKCTGYFDRKDFDDQAFYLKRIFSKIVKKKSQIIRSKVSIETNCDGMDHRLSNKSITNFVDQIESVQRKVLEADSLPADFCLPK